LADVIRLETPRLLFRDHELEDLAPYCAMESDPQYRGPQRVHPREELERRFHEGPLEPKDFALFATVYKPEGCYIGRSGLYPFRNERSEIVPLEAFIAWYFARPYWSRGLATEAGEAWIAHGFDTMGLRRIEAGVNAANVASLRVVEKLGFRWIRSGGDGVTRRHDFELWNPRVRPRLDDASSAR
jgi:[ribosomal protein S5]-alanine N-acetyltransferase